MSNDLLRTLLAILTTLPALAWNVNAIIHARKYYKENKEEIHKKKKEITQRVEEEVKKGAETVQKEAEKFSKNVSEGKVIPPIKLKPSGDEQKPAEQPQSDESEQSKDGPAQS